MPEGEQAYLRTVAGFCHFSAPAALLPGLIMAWLRGIFLSIVPMWAPLPQSLMYLSSHDLCEVGQCCDPHFTDGELEYTEAK